MHEMSPPEVASFLGAGTRTGKLATTLADGTPHVTPIWFVLDADDLVFTTHESSVKAKAFRRDPRAALCVDDQEPPYSYVHVRGTVTLSDDLDDLVRWATEIGGRYMGPDRAEEFGRRNGVPGELLVRLAPDRVIGQAAVSA